MAKLPQLYENFQQEYTSVWQAYQNLGAAAAQTGPLEIKMRELIKLGMSAATGQESAVHSHTHRALENGATWQEVEHAIVIGIATIGFPRTMAALAWAKAAIEQYES
jgi:4-carboxymuconolactone decarboxylase